MKKFALYALCVIPGAAAALSFCRLWVPEQKQTLPEELRQQPQPKEETTAEESQAPRLLTGYGYIRGRSCTTLRNKY